MSQFGVNDQNDFLLADGSVILEAQRQKTLLNKQINKERTPINHLFLLHIKVQTVTKKEKKKERKESPSLF